MRVKVKFVIGKSEDIKFVDVAKMSFVAVAKALGITPRQIISVVKD